MPKVGVVKLDEYGEYTGQSTFSGSASIPIHYSFQKNKFYFNSDDLKKIGIDPITSTTSAKSRDGAIALLEFELGRASNKEKYLWFNVVFNLDGKIETNDVSKKITDYAYSSRGNSSRIEFSYGKCLKAITPHANELIYIQTDDDFVELKRKSTIYQQRNVFIKYTPQREEFLKSIVDGIQTINDKLLTFFVDCESEERVAEQIDIIENSKNLLGAGSK